jgi:hypothetical protein
VLVADRGGGGGPWGDAWRVRPWSANRIGVTGSAAMRRQALGHDQRGRGWSPGGAARRSRRRWRSRIAPTRAARWLTGDVAQELQELGLLAEGAGGSLAHERSSYADCRGC